MHQICALLKSVVNMFSSLRILSTFVGLALFGLGCYWAVQATGGKAITFDYHPMFMLLAFVVFMTEGLNAYYADFFILISKGDPHGRTEWTRKWHAGAQILACICAVLGWLFIYLAHEQGGKPHFPVNASWTHYVHVTGGYATLGLVAIQLISGIAKRFFPRTFAKINLKWHGKVGIVAYTLGLITIVFGSYLFLNKYWIVFLVVAIYLFGYILYSRSELEKLRDGDSHLMPAWADSYRSLVESPPHLYQPIA